MGTISIVILLLNNEQLMPMKKWHYIQNYKEAMKVLCIDGIKISTHVNFYKVHYIVIKSMWVYENLLTIIISYLYMIYQNINSILFTIVTEQCRTVMFNHYILLLS